jgi:acyl carrier protein
MRTDVEHLVKVAIAAEKHMDDSEVEEGDTLAEILGVDSVDRAYIAMALEDEFDIVLSDEELGKVATVAELQNLVRGKLVKQ